MRSRFFSLYLALLNVNYGFSFHKYYYIKKRRRIWEPLLLIIALTPALIGFVGFLWVMTEQLFIGGLAFEQPHLALVYGSLLVVVTTLFFGFFQILSSFYFSTDLQVLLAWPLKSWEILLARFGVVLTGQYVVNLLILLPVWIRYGLLARAGLSYVISACIVFFILPVLPLALASVGAVLIMRFTNLSKYKDRFTLIGGIIFVILILGFQFWIQNNATEDPDLFMSQILNQTDGLVRVAGRIFPTSIWAAQAMAYSTGLNGWLKLLFLLIVSLLGLGTLYLLGEKVFLPAAVSGLEGDKGGTRSKEGVVRVKRRSVFTTLTAMEIKLFIRDPNFALNGLVGYVMLPVLAALPLFQKGAGSPMEIMGELQLPPLLIIGVVPLFFMLMTAISMIPTTTFSREGKYLWIIRSLPLTIKRIIMPRVVACQVINTIGCLVGLIPLVFIFKLNILAVGIGVVFGVPLATALALLLTFVDLRRPLLDWVNPIKAVKSNFNAMLGLFGAMFICIAMGILLVLFYQRDQLWLVIPLLTLLLLCLIILSRYLLTKVAAEYWNRIEGGFN